MNNVREILDLINEMSQDSDNIELHDSFDIEIGEDLLIESGVIAINEDGILIEGDDKTLELLEEHGVILEETDWSKYDEPTVSRIAKGKTKPVDRTDYDVPPAMRKDTKGKPGYELRKDNLKDMGALKEEDVEESGLQAYLGKKKYGVKGMKALQQAGREGASKEEMAQLRAKYDKLDEKMVMGLPGDQGSKVMGEVSEPPKMSSLEQDALNLDKLKDQYNKLQSAYDAMEPHTWMYADFDQNLSTKERKARDMKDELSILFNRIKRAEAYDKKLSTPVELPDNVKKVVKFIADKVKSDSQNWDSTKNTFTEVGLKNLADALGYKKNYIEYAKSLYNDNLEEAKLPAAALMSLLSLAGVDTEALAYTDPTKSVEELARENPKVKELLVRINALGQKPASDIAAEKWRKQQDQLKPATAGPDEKIPTPVQDKMDEAKYQGREVPLGKPMKGDVKKKKVYVRKPNGNVVKVEFGDPNMRIKKSNPKRRKSFRARHRCDNPGPRWKARYWSCRAW